MTTEQYTTPETDSTAEWKNLFIPIGAMLLNGADFTASILAGENVTTAQKIADDKYQAEERSNTWD